jgi:hypothetical protein
VIPPVPAPVAPLIWSPSARYSSPKEEIEAINRIPQASMKAEHVIRIAKLVGF